MRKLTALANAIVRSIIDRSSVTGSDAQIKGLSGRTTPDVELFQPQGLVFRAPSGAEGVALAVAGIAESAVVVCAHARNAMPGDVIAEGEGGLHYMGTWKVFLDEDGNLSLGARDASDFVALASLVDARITALQAKLDALIVSYSSHVHPGVTAGAASTSPTLSVETALGSQATVASEIVKCE